MMYKAQKNFFTRNSKDTLVHKQEHVYFCQCQMQMGVTNTTYCDFVV